VEDTGCRTKGCKIWGCRSQIALSCAVGQAMVSDYLKAAAKVG